MTAAATLQKGSGESATEVGRFSALEASDTNS